MPRLDTPVFVGREADLSVLLAHGEEAETGNPRLVLVGGDAGVGKSRLVAEAVTRLVDRGFTAAFGSCVDIPGLEVAQVPFGPFREAARRLGGPAAAAWLRPGGGTDVSNPTPDAEPAYERLSGFLDLIATVTSDGPLVLVLEDLHWADRSSLALLVFLAHNLTLERVLLLATVREQADAAEAALEHLVRQPGVARLNLGPLPDEFVRSLVAQLPLQRSKASMDAVVARAEGNPLVAYELAQSDTGKLPPNLASSIRDRLRRASEPARAALTAAAVAGPAVEHALLLRLLEVQLPEASAGERDEAVREAVETGLLRPDGDGYRFRHGLDRDAIYSGLLPGRRQVLHRAAALALADTGELDSGLAARVAAHWRHAGDRDAARRAALDAARAARAVGAYPEALAQYEHVLDRPVDPEVAGLLVEAAEAARLSGDLPKATGLLERATGHPLPPGPAARAWERLGWFRHEAGDDDGSAAAYERALQVIAGNPDPEAAPRVLSAHARSLMLAGQFAAAGAKAREALGAIVTPEPSGEAGASALITLGTVIANGGQPDEGLAMMARGRDLASALGAEQERWRYLTNVVYVLQNLGRNAEAADVALGELATVRDRRWLPPAANGAAANAAECLLHLGRWQEAEDLLEEITRRRPPPRFLFQLTMCRAELELQRGRREAAAEHLETVARIFATIRDPDDRSAVHRLRAESAWQLGDVAAARRHVDAALDELQDSEEYESQVTVLALGLRVEADAGQLPAGRDAKRLERLAGQLEATASQVRETQPDARLEIQLARAELLRAGGESDRAHWASVIDEARLLDRPYLQAYAWLQAGQTALRARKRTEAQAALVTAASLAERLGAAWLLASARATMTRGRLGDDAGAAPAAPTRAASAGLTAREIQVLALLAEGRTNRVIARELGMSEKTASVHVSRILAKLGASTRGEAAAAARTLHLLEDAVPSPPELLTRQPKLDDPGGA